MIGQRSKSFRQAASAQARLWLAALIGVAAVMVCRGFAAAQPKPITACGSISQTGSYILNANISLSSTTANCISVTANGVTIDLNGFVVSGKGGNSVGIYSSGNTLSVHNGTLTGFGRGIAAASAGARISNITVVNSTGATGVFLGSAAQVSDSLFLNNTQSGLEVGANSLITHCLFGNNGVNGLYAVGLGTVVTENSSGSNKNVGFSTAGKATLVANAANGNGVENFYDSVGANTYDTDAASGGSFGFHCGAPVPGKIQCTSVFIGNVADSNSSDGFADAGGSTFRANTADSNNVYGFASDGETTFTGNTSDNNKVGFSVVCPSGVLGNTALNNSVAASSLPGCVVSNNLGF
jgi:hypothetical protein